jgi:YD repeat-containing protein
VSQLNITVNGITTTLGIDSAGAPAVTMTGSTGSAAGTSGSVPAPAADKQGAFLRGDATWSLGAISNMVFTSGQLTGYTEDGIAYTLAYNGNGTLNTISGGGTVGTVQYTSGAVSGISYT